MLRTLLWLMLVMLGGSCAKDPPRVLLTWLDNSDNEDCFVIERKQVGGDSDLLVVVARNCQAYIDGSVHEGETYQYQIRAQNRFGCSTAVTSNAVTVGRPTAASPGVASCAAGSLAGVACGTCPPPQSASQ